jgi:hypothetical protein
MRNCGLGQFKKNDKVNVRDLPEKWDKGGRETDKSFAAFTLYLQLGENRTAKAAAESAGRSVSLFARWSRKFNWIERAAAYDAHQDLIRKRALEQAAVRSGVDWAIRGHHHREDEWALRAELVLACRTCLAKFRDGSRGATLGDIARALDQASKLGRLASGLDLEKPMEETGPGESVLKEIENVLDQVFSDDAKAAVVLDVEAVPPRPEPAKLAAPLEGREPVLRMIGGAT